MSLYQNRIYNPNSAAADTDAMQLRMQAQSIMTTGGKAAPLPSYEEAVVVIAKAREQSNG